MSNEGELCRRRTTCRLCDSANLALVLSLTPTPPANAFVGQAQLHERQPVYPLDVVFCRSCAHVQLSHVVDPKHLFSNYLYVSGTSPVFVRHFATYAEAVIASAKLAPGDLVVEIGSNDGTLLRQFRDRGVRVLGVDPARDISEGATASGIETRTAFFNGGLATSIRSERGPAHCICANNVLAHVDDLGGLVDAARSLLAPRGVLVFEVSYLGDVLAKTLFDTIYHEHLDYHSVAPLIGFFRRHGMELFHVERVDTHGGSLRGYACLKDGGHAIGSSVAALVVSERAQRMDREDTFRAFAGQIATVGAQARQCLSGLRRDGRTVVGFGAPAKATTLMYEFGLGRETIEFIVDDSPLKQGLFSPGLHVPILPSAALYERKADYAVILAWNFADSIMRSHAKFREAGGHFIVPLPQLTIH